MGATATMVATQRALATRERLIDDPFAEPLVHAVDNDYFNRLVDGEIDLAELDPEFSVRRSAKSMAVRTRFFDRMFTDAAAAGVRQAVILAAGLDARAYRLRWPEGRRCTKWTSPTSSNLRLERWPNWWPNLPAIHRPIAVDLRNDWRKTLWTTLQRHCADRTEPGGPADLPAASGTGPTVRHDHRTQRAGQPARHRTYPGQERLLR
jgi:methyltransferase (TIGR00027 family)